MGGKIQEIDAIADRARLRQMDPTVMGDLHEAGLAMSVRFSSFVTVEQPC